MKLQAGDRMITRTLSGFNAPFSSAIAWWLHSKWSHAVPILSESTAINITLFGITQVDIASTFFTGDHHVKILRPLKPIDLQAWQLAGLKVLTKQYDLLSFAGFI